ncbi:MAG TPA: FecR domain-containing protein [Flavobacterium sp.]
MEQTYALAKWLAGEMTESELEAFRNSPEYATYARIAEVSAKFQTPVFDQEKMYSNIIGSKKAPKVIPLQDRMWVRIAAILVIFLGLAFFIKSNYNQKVYAGNGETSTCALPDNSQVILNADSEICYTSWNWENDRTVELDGEAYFRVAKGEKFVVSTKLGKVSVLGTQFDVKAREDRFDVSCYEGRVRVDYKSQSVIITKGQHVAFENGKFIEIPQSTVAQPEWLDDEVAFEKENLKNILNELSRQYDIKITSKADAKQRFTGTLPLNNINEALQILSSTFHLTPVKENGGITLVAVDGR